MNLSLVWSHLLAIAIATVDSVDETYEDYGGDCPENYWDKPSKRCSLPFATNLERLQLTMEEDGDWTSDIRTNRTCGSWQETNACYQRLLRLCRSDLSAVKELQMHIARYSLYSFTCSQQQLNQRQALFLCLLPHIKPTITCTEVFDKYFRNFIAEKQYRNACRAVNTAMKCFHDIHEYLRQHCSDSSAPDEYRRHYIQPTVEQTRIEISSASCSVPVTYTKYFNDAPTLHSPGLRQATTVPLFFAIIGAVVNALLLYTKWRHCLISFSGRRT